MVEVLGYNGIENSEVDQRLQNDKEGRRYANCILERVKKIILERKKYFGEN